MTWINKKFYYFIVILLSWVEYELWLFVEIYFQKKKPQKVSSDDEKGDEEDKEVILLMEVLMH